MQHQAHPELKRGLALPIPSLPCTFSGLALTHSLAQPSLAQPFLTLALPSHIPFSSGSESESTRLSSLPESSSSSSRPSSSSQPLSSRSSSSWAPGTIRGAAALLTQAEPSLGGGGQTRVKVQMVLEGEGPGSHVAHPPGWQLPSVPYKLCRD